MSIFQKLKTTYKEGLEKQKKWREESEQREREREERMTKEYDERTKKLLEEAERKEKLANSKKAEKEASERRRVADLKAKGRYQEPPKPMPVKKTPERTRRVIKRPVSRKPPANSTIQASGAYQAEAKSKTALDSAISRADNVPGIRLSRPRSIRITPRTPRLR